MPRSALSSGARGVVGAILAVLLLGAGVLLAQQAPPAPPPPDPGLSPDPSEPPVGRRQRGGWRDSRSPAAGRRGSPGAAGTAGSATAGSGSQPGSVGRPGSADCALSRSFVESGSGGRHLSAGGGAGQPVGAKESRDIRAGAHPGRTATELGRQRAGAGGFPRCPEAAE